MSSRLLLIVIVVKMLITAQAQFDNSTCGTGKGCMWSTPGCDPMTNCTSAFSWRVVNNTYLYMELTGISSNGAMNYISVGFSSDQSMGSEPVTDCTFGGVGGTAAHLSYNNGKQNSRITDYPYLSSQLQLISSNISNGRLYCAFQQLIYPQQSDSRIPPLNGKYFLLIVLGTATNQALNQHNLNSNDPSYPTIAGSMVNLTDTNAYSSQVTIDLSSTTKQQLIKAHGMMMIIAWFILVATGIMFARYFKGHWPDTKPYGLLLWFHFHRTFNSIAVLLMIASFVCIFSAFNWRWMGPPTNTDYWGAVHAIVGLLACVLAWTQPIGAIFRCNPGKPLRPVFNWLHRFSGLTAWILAATAITICATQSPSVWSNISTARGLCIAYLVFTGVVIMLQELITVAEMIRNRNFSRVEDLKKQIVGHSPDWATTPDTNPSMTNAKTNTVRMILMGLFVVISWSLAVALIVLVATA